MADTPPYDDRTGAQAGPGRDLPEPQAIRERAYELSQLRPRMTAEEHWLLAEAELLAAQEQERRIADLRAREDEAALMAKIKMGVFGHP